MVKTNSKSQTTYEKEVWCCKGNARSYINGLIMKSNKYMANKLASKFKVSTATIRDIIARRSWNYSHL